MNTTAAPINKPNRFLGLAMSSTPVYCKSVTFLAAFVTASRNEPNNAVAARTAVAMAIPLVIAFVELPTASRLVRIAAPWAFTSPDISAIPCALSETGPKVSIETITPTVVNKPVPANAIANKPSITEPPPSKNAPYTPAPINNAE